MMLRRIFLVLAAGAGSMALFGGCTKELPYQGETIRMRIRRWGVAAYPEVHPDDVAKVQRIMRAAVFPTTFRNRDELSRAILELKLPNYGLSGGDFKSPSGTPLELNCVEIPDSATHRCLLYALESDGTYTKQDDFLAAARIVGATDARVEPDRVVYSGRDGRVVWSRPVRIR